MWGVGVVCAPFFFLLFPPSPSQDGFITSKTIQHHVTPVAPLLHRTRRTKALNTARKGHTAHAGSKIGRSVPGFPTAYGVPRPSVKPSHLLAYPNQSNRTVW
ncbi:hypothetical protein BO70DRAFT_365357 [Aspergillus heteromorphus CBS 117.55]|uniref:Secreted protein n=1 Tax=Aspergillus heteromorphus CBS 117.55 TaxID=1448321 RepID=A0A317VBG7_9EURO|nr:uncharacterized protein BO70DRAFT_365357 [Aspergillus heteromorphus CBS 117.55]PWY70417.1 hypothetical protein BO70DRAFT_365357 [Aspergillus heteromorphus CBS 117.55]